MKLKQNMILFTLIIIGIIMLIVRYTESFVNFVPLDADDDKFTYEQTFQKFKAKKSIDLATTCDSKRKKCVEW